ncbi:MAG: PAS domain-containing protein [Deltaproteobacteria bacterium]|jgi:PAS domain S-box-containing protein|nr:PAS domain-containing protein [Deltaproteobacteria bacterium]MBT4268488.1 PAS domain-containing protein [Deltaproteobacteria bacterium]MBT4644419.1 PAS domain-containing protein [Deltaproteobacteria bacterium]MBT7466158.1 PAS domain-containing protein [Bacteroidota bacterium]MBT7892817.1 PAS domain-containing protein [Deltaproteobacteria bacterium]
MSNKPTYEELEQRVKELEQDSLQRKQMEETLQEYNIWHSTMISNIGDVIGIMGIDGIMKYKSPNIERWFGWKPEDLVGSSGWHTVHPEDIERIQKEFIKVLERDNTQAKVEYRYKCKDGTYTPPWLTWWAITIYLLSGFITVFLLIQYRTRNLIQRKLELEGLVMNQCH